MSSTGTYTVNSGYWSDGETITLSDVTLYTQKANGPQPSIDSLLKTYGDGDWFFQVVSQVSKLSVTENNAGTVTYTAIQPAAGLDVTYSANNVATNIAATIDHTPIS
ncbi:Uncharacterised protein [uncultured archaeon]|nr:Uncharacterised protein [uncultured archaeon]